MKIRTATETDRPSWLFMRQALWLWFLENQRILPWRTDRTPYRVWLSEIMLQQTQVATVIDYYNRFIAKFPTVEDLAKAPEDNVLALWSGLGYYSRARNLHRCAQIVATKYQGQFPNNHQELQKLPGIGSYTAGAILAFAFNQPSPVVDGNIARVFSRLFDDHTLWGDAAGKKHFEQISLEYAQQAPSCLIWQEGLMELGALICKPTNPNCQECPFVNTCLAKQRGTIEQLPVKQAKPEKTRLDVVCALVHTQDSIWLEKNHTNALFKGLYAPPNLTTTLETHCTDFQVLLDRLGLKQPDNKPFFTVQRTLTHRNLVMHAKIIDMPNPILHSPNWIKKSALDQIGLSAAIKSLLHKAAFLALLFVFGPIGCSHKRASIRYIRKIQPEAPKQNPFEYAKSLIGQSRASLNGKNYRADCSGTVKAIYDAARWSLGGAEGTEGIFNYLKKNGTIDKNSAKPGDLVFFHSGDKRQALNHIGFVEEVLPDGTILFIHHMSGLVIRSRMNLKNPSVQIDPKTKARLNHILRRSGNGKSYTGAELFAGFGRRT